MVFAWPVTYVLVYAAPGEYKTTPDGYANTWDD